MPVHLEDREGSDAPPVRLVGPDGSDVIQTDGTILVSSQKPVAVTLLLGSSVATTSKSIDRGTYRGPCAIVAANIGGSSPTVNVDIQGSVDNVNFYNCAYALVATPNTVAVAQISITATATTTYLLPTDQAWRYLRVVTSTVNNDPITIVFYI